MADLLIVERNRKQYKENLDNIVSRNDGWISYINTVHTIDSPLLVVTNQEFTIPLRGDSFIDEGATELMKTLVDNNTNKIIVPNLLDSYIIRIEFMLKTKLDERKGFINFDIGIPKRFNHTRFQGPDDAVEPEPVSILVPFYQLTTFLQNGALIRSKINGEAEIYDIITTFFKLSHGKNI